MCTYEDNESIGFSKYKLYIQSIYIFTVKRDTRMILQYLANTEK